MRLVSRLENLHDTLMLDKERLPRRRLQIQQWDSREAHPPVFVDAGKGAKQALVRRKLKYQF